MLSVDLKVERRPVAIAVQAEVRGVWALHEVNDIGAMRVSHIPSGCAVYTSDYPQLARKVWAYLGEKVPRFAEALRFACDEIARGSMDSLRALIAHAEAP